MRMLRVTTSIRYTYKAQITLGVSAFATHSTPFGLYGINYDQTQKENI